jgi:hypothetical protein
VRDRKGRRRRQNDEWLCDEESEKRRART